MITVYRLNDSGVLLGQETIRAVDPLPVPCTDIAPPPMLGGHYAVFNSGVWSLVAGSWSPPQDGTEVIKARHWESIKAERDRRIQSGGFLVAGKWFHSDTFSRTQQMGLVMMGGNIPSGLHWKTMDGSFVTMTQSMAAQVFAAAAISDAALFSRAEQIKAAMESDPAAFNLAAQSWPMMFGD